MRADQRRGTWLDPASGKMRLGEWMERWVETIDVETRTDEICCQRLRLHVLPSGVISAWARSPPPR